jgi:hypothetical protein
VRSARRAGLPGIAAVCAVAGCGTAKIELSAVEDQFRRQFASELGADITSVDCPADVVAKKGATFTCLITGADGTRATIKVTQTDDDGHVTANAPLLVHTGELATTLERELRPRLGRSIDITCPDVVEGRRGTRLTCALAARGRKLRRVVVRFPRELEGGKGNFRYEVM